MRNGFKVQQTVAIAGSWVFLFGLVALLALLGLGPASTPVTAMIAGGAGTPLFLGYWLTGRFARGNAEGPWMWVLPAAAFCLAVLWTGLRFSWSQVWNDFFSLSGPNEAGLGVLIFTVPVCSSILYSAGALLRTLGR
jgi:hypothetical protein